MAAGERVPMQRLSLTDSFGLDNVIISLNSLWPLELDYIKKRQDSRQTGDEEGRAEAIEGDGKRAGKGKREGKGGKINEKD